MDKKPLMEKENKSSVMDKVKDVFTKQEGVKSTNSKIKYEKL